MAEPQQQNPTDGINPENNHMAGDPLINNRPRNNNNANQQQQQPVRYKRKNKQKTVF